MSENVVSVDSLGMEAQYTYADLILSYLSEIDVGYIFGVPGGAIEPLYNAIARQLRTPLITRHRQKTNFVPLRQRRTSDSIQPIIARHESGAAFMADGYARETGKLGVCCATTGPGATNLITGVASAYADRVPMLVITPQTALPDFGRLGLQESSSDAVDIVSMFEHCTRYNSLVSHPNQLEGKLNMALLHAFRRPRGPVHLSIPMDILNAPLASELTAYQMAHLFRQPRAMDEAAYVALLNALNCARKPVFFIGNGSRHAINTITAIAEYRQIPMIATPAGKSWVNAYHPLYRGVFGFGGHSSAFDTLMDDEVDLILAIGTSLGEISTASWDRRVLNRKLVHITGTPEDFARSPMACLHVLCDVRTLFTNLQHDLMPNEPQPRRDNIIRAIGDVRPRGYVPESIAMHAGEQCYSDAVPLKPQRVMRELAERFPESARYVIDAGNAWAWVTHYLMLRRAGMQRFGFGFGAMGWAIGAAVGTALGCRGEPVICITGDGSWLMSAQELTTALQQRLPVIFVVLNDQALGMVKHGQRLGGAEAIGFELPPVDFAAMARAMGAVGHTIRSPQDFAALDIAALCQADKPCVLDVYVDSEETPPMGARVKTLRRSNKLE